MRRKCPPMLLLDFYKLQHRPQYPDNTSFVLATWIARRSYIPGIDYTVAFGFQHFIIKYLIDYFDENFFDLPIDIVINDYEEFVSNTLGLAPDHEHIRELHELGFLPLHIRAVPEGTKVPLRVPSFTIENTDERFFWLTNYVETLLSCELWTASTSATLANEFRKLLEGYALKTNPEAFDFVQFQGHDFSFRGMSSVETAQLSGMGHLLSFVGTDTAPAIWEAREYYAADYTKETVGTSIPATEHSVMSAAGKDNELETYRRLITKIYPDGFISIVSDTWDLWHVITQTLGVDLHDEVMARDGRIVVRPDSGDPVQILCGDGSLVVAGHPDTRTPAEKGVIELLWELFGGTISSTGYKVLDSHIGCIYGDSINYARAAQICAGLEEKGFASTNTVYGIGSFSYQYQTRDTFGTAMKATWVVINDEELAIYKDPITDDGMKKSLTGRVVVMHDAAGKIIALDNLTLAEAEELADDDLLEDVFLNGHLVRFQTFADIRARVREDVA